jgi:hypothetical protein
MLGMNRFAAVALVVVLVGLTVGVVVIKRADGKPAPTSAGPTVGPAVGQLQVKAVSFLGPDYDPKLVPKPTRDPTQSRLWFYDSAWWTILLASSGQGATAAIEQRIFRLDPGAPGWVDTGTLVDDRPAAHLDVVAEGDRIDVASAGWGSGPRNGVRLYSFQYDPTARRYSLAADSPINITDYGMRSVVLARDSSKRLWVAGVAAGKLLVSHSTQGSPQWTTAVAPGSLARAATIEQVTIVVIGDQIAVAWTDPDKSTLVISRHKTTDPDGEWSEIPVQLNDGTGLSGEVSAAAAQGPDGQRLLVTAQARYPTGASTGDSPDIVVVAVEPDGSWRPHLLSRVGDRQSHPRLLTGAEGKTVYAMVTGPTQGKGSAIYVKQSPAQPLAFPTAVGAALVAFDGAEQVDFATTKGQPIDPSNGLVAVASDLAGKYATGFIVLADAFPKPPTLPVQRPGRVLVRDTFDAWLPGSPLGAIWSPAGEGNGPLVAASVAGGDGLVARVSTGADQARNRVCRSFPPVAAGKLRFETRVRLAGVGTSDGTIAIRANGTDMAVVRLGKRGTLSYFNGPTVVETAIRYLAATWYRSVITADLGTHTYEWQLLRDDGVAVISAIGLHFQSTAPDPLSAVCVESPAGAPSLALDFDDVLVQQ